jgi:hypothetical protein
VSGRGYMLRSARGDWRTPPEIVERVREAFGGRIGTDPCAAPDPLVSFASVSLAGPTGSPADGLAQEWSRTAYVNPPFGDLAAWAAKCEAEAQRGCEVILLLPARTDTRYWHEHVASAALVCFLRGRLKFVGAPGACPFPTALAYWGSRPALFHAAFAPLGMVVVPSSSKRARVAGSAALKGEG